MYLSQFPYVLYVFMCLYWEHVASWHLIEDGPPPAREIILSYLYIDSFVFSFEIHLINLLEGLDEAPFISIFRFPHFLQ